MRVNKDEGGVMKVVNELGKLLDRLEVLLDNLHEDYLELLILVEQAKKRKRKVRRKSK